MGESAASYSFEFFLRLDHVGPDQMSLLRSIYSDCGCVIPEEKIKNASPEQAEKVRARWLNYEGAQMFIEIPDEKRARHISECFSTKEFRSLKCTMLCGFKSYTLDFLRPRELPKYISKVIRDLKCGVQFHFWLKT